MTPILPQAYIVGAAPCSGSLLVDRAARGVELNGGSSGALECRTMGRSCRSRQLVERPAMGMAHARLGRERAIRPTPRAGGIWTQEEQERAGAGQASAI